MIFNSDSLSGYIIRFLGGFSLLLLIMTFALLLHADWSPWNIGIAITLLGAVLSSMVWVFNKKVLSSFERILFHLEALKSEDYNQYSKSEFTSGVTNELHYTLSLLSEKLQAHKSRYDQHAFLLYKLIDQLDTPVLVFNQRQLLSYANPAFSTLYGEPWQVYRQASTKILGLEFKTGRWLLNRNDQRWQINQSEFIDSGERHLLLVFTNIDSALRASQLSAWQQIIRVLGHEIRNSLTPVSSLVESLNTKLTSTREKKALDVIYERCLHLQDFVNRYSTLSQQLHLDVQPVKVSEFERQLIALFEDKSITFSHTVNEIMVDPTFFQQVFINLIKNAFEASAKTVRIQIKQSGSHVCISVIDDGFGLANPANLFVPLYTTKQNGQGIGLAFCRNVVEQHKGTIALKNNQDKEQGARVDISLPVTI